MPLHDLRHVGVYLSQIPSEGIRDLIFDEKVCPSKVAGVSEDKVRLTFRVGRRTFVVVWDLEKSEVAFYELKRQRRYRVKRQPLSELGWLIEVRSSLLTEDFTLSAKDRRSLLSTEMALSEHYEYYDPLGVEPPHDTKQV